MSTNPVPAVEPTSGERTPTARDDKKAPSNSSARRAEKTATRKPRRKAQEGIIASQSAWMQNGVAMMRAEGMSQEKISKALDLSPNTVSRMLDSPKVQSRVSELREIHRLVTQEKMASIVDKTWALTEKTLDDKDPQDFMRMTAGLSNLEKVSASASGEKQKVEVSGVPGTVAPKVEIRNLLVQLFGPTQSSGGN